MTSVQSGGHAVSARSNRLPMSGIVVYALVWLFILAGFASVAWFWIVGPLLRHADSIASDSQITDEPLVEAPTHQPKQPIVPLHAVRKPLVSSDEVELLGQQAADRSRRIAIESDLKRIAARLNEIDDLDSRWKNNIARLSSAEDGQRIAGSPVQLERYALLLKRKSPVEAGPNVQRERLQAQQTALSAAGEDAILARTPNSVEALDRLRSESAQLVEFFRERERMLDAVIEDSRTIPPAVSSLSESLAAFLAERDSETDQLITQLIAEAKQEATMSVVTAEQMKKQAEIDLSNARLRLAESQFPVPADSTDAASSVRRVTRTEFQAELPTIRQLLSPFISPGYVQPVTSIEFRPSTEKTPVSLSVLKQLGALDPDDEGLLALLRIGGSRQEGRANDRPLGSFPQFHSELDIRKSRVRAAVARAQTLLRMYGEFMVEDGLLIR